MPKIEPLNQDLKQLEGLHLWHAAMSSCSQRVRIVLAEMEKEFTSHPVALEHNEHADPAYQQIHPQGLVPAFVEDGELFIESIDIIQKIAGSESGLGAVSDDSLLQMADEAQADLKLMTYEFLFRGGPKPSPEKVKKFEADHHNDTLKQFKRDFAAGFGKERIDAGVNRTAEGFEVLEERLSDGRTFLEGETFTLSDVAWMPNVHRFGLMDWPFERTPLVQAWFKRVSARPSYKAGLADWEVQQAVGGFRQHTKDRQAAGTDISTFGKLGAS